MSFAVRERDPAYELGRELHESAVLISQIKTFCEDDADFLVDSLEGETNVLELIDKLYAASLDDDIIIEGSKAVLEKIEERVRRAKARKERRRTLIANTLNNLGLKKHKSSHGVTMTISPQPIKAIVLEEAEVPTRFFRRPDPVIDQAALTKYVREREKLLAEIGNERDAAKREALSEIAKNLPPIPGVTASNGGVQLTIR
jgi:hypothetical protein